MDQIKRLTGKMLNGKKMHIRKRCETGCGNKQIKNVELKVQTKKFGLLLVHFFLLFCFVCLKIGHKLIAFLLLLVGRCLTYSFLHTLFRLQNTFCVLLISALCLLLCSTDVGVVVYALMRK